MFLTHGMYLFKKIKVNKDSGKFLVHGCVVAVYWAVTSLGLGLAALWQFKRETKVVP